MKLSFFILILISLFNLSCLKAKRSPFDMSTPQGLGAGYALIVENFNSTTSGTTATSSMGLVFNQMTYTFYQGVAITPITPTVTGTVTGCSSSISLPSGLSIDNITCVISGTPTVTSPAANYTIKVSGTAGSSATAVITITVISSVPTNLVYAFSSYTFTKDALIDTITPTVTGTITSCSISSILPTGLLFNTTTCEISGTPTVLSPVTSYTITASNSYGGTTATISITVNIDPPTITYTGSPYAYTFGTAIVTNTPSVTGTVTGCTSSPPLPTGLDIIINTTCAISGTPIATSAATNYTITASNSSGSTAATITISVTCPYNTVTYSWGTFTEICDGTIKFDGLAGTFGGNDYTAQTLYFAKCSYGQTYSGGTCAGTVSPAAYCSADDSSCDNGIILTGTGTSGAYTACNNMNTGSTFGKTNWRVPTKNELKLLINCNTLNEMPYDGNSCSGYTPPTISNLFPNTQPGYYWSSSQEFISQAAWDVDFNSSYVLSDTKTTNNYVRCVSGP